MDRYQSDALIVWFFVTLGALLAIWLVARSRATAGLRLMLLGIIVMLAALWYGLLSGSVPHSAGALPLVSAGLADAALRLAAVMILGGVVLTLLARDVISPIPVPPEAPRNVPPSV
jgi:hypothetical protein